MKTQREFQNGILLFVVFCTGACVLILEILSTRMLAPYYGNTIFAFTSIIGVTLAALSIGYYAGGQLADRRPYASWFYSIILASGVSVFFTKLLSTTVLPAFADLFSLVYGPLAFSVLLFTAPAALLGFLSPYAIRLLQSLDRKTGVGGLSGSVFFWSTCGSIAGTFAAGFLLIPRLGVQSILLFLGSFLFVMGSAGLLCTRFTMKKIAFIAAAFALSAAFCAASTEPVNPAIVYSAEGLYDSIVVYDADLEGRPARFLRQNMNPSSAIFLDNHSPAFDYTRYYAMALALQPQMSRALVIGAGAFSLPAALIGQSSAMVDVVDPEPVLLDIARRYFGLEPSAQLQVTVGDGRSFLQGKEGTYDLIFSDAYQNLHAIPPHLATREFFTASRAALSDRGMFMINLSGDLRPQTPSLIWSAIRTLRDVFPHSTLFAVNDPQSLESQNIIFIGCNRVVCENPCASITGRMKTPFLREACDKQISLKGIDLSRHAMLTDDYAPIEYLAARSL